MTTRYQTNQIVKQYKTLAVNPLTNKFGCPTGDDVKFGVYSIVKGVNITYEVFQFTWSAENTKLTVTSTFVDYELQKSRFRANCITTNDSEPTYGVVKSQTQSPSLFILDLEIRPSAGVTLDDENLVSINFWFTKVEGSNAGPLDARITALCRISETQSTLVSNFSGSPKVLNLVSFTINSTSLADIKGTYTNKGGSAYASAGVYISLYSIALSGTVATIATKYRYKVQHNTVVSKTTSSGTVNTIYINAHNYTTIEGSTANVNDRAFSNTGTIMGAMSLIGGTDATAVNKEDSVEPRWGVYPICFDSLVTKYHTEQFVDGGLNGFQVYGTKIMKWKSDGGAWFGLSDSEVAEVKYKVNGYYGGIATATGQGINTNPDKEAIGGIGGYSSHYDLDTRIDYTDATGFLKFTAKEVVGESRGITFSILGQSGVDEYWYQIVLDTALFPDANKVKIHLVSQDSASSSRAGITHITIVNSSTIKFQCKTWDNSTITNSAYRYPAYPTNNSVLIAQNYDSTGNMIP